jgi:serine/threonine-protein kinase RsbW
MEQKIARDGTLDNLQALRDFVGAHCLDCEGDADACHALELAVDEAVTNVVLHGYDGLPPGPIELTFACTDGEAVVTITDRGQPFVPEKIPPPDLHSAWEERQVGGLGWHLIQEMTDEVRYFPDNQAGNRLVLRKRLRPAA